MNKLLSLFVFIVLFCIVGYSTFRLLDSDKILRLPFSQNIVTTQEKNVLGSSNLDIAHIVIIVMENKSSRDIMGNPDAPYINSLAQTYSYTDNYFAVAHPSLPNYIALIGGDTFGIKSDCTDCLISSANLVDQLEKAHKSWKAYMEGMPASCFVGSSGDYAQKHDPFIYFDDIRNTPEKCQKIVPFTSLSQDLQSADTFPDFVWITPNLCHDMHNCPVSTGDSWLQEEVPQILTSPAFTKQKSLLVITWDEGENNSDNKIPTLFVGNVVKKGYVSHTSYSHYSLTHTIEDMWNLPSLTANTAQSSVIQDIFSTP